MTPTHDLPHAKSTWATALDEYVADMREAHGANAATTQEAYARANELMKAAQYVVSGCRQFGGTDHAVEAAEWMVNPDQNEARLLALSVRVAELEADRDAV